MAENSLHTKRKQVRGDTRHLCGQLAALLLSCFVVGADVTEGNFGAEKTGPKPAAPAGKQGAVDRAPKAGGKTYPFHGTLAEVSEGTSSIKLAGKTKQRLIKVTPKTHVTRDGKRARLSDGVPGTRVTGSVKRNAEGEEEALTVRFAVKTSAPTKAKADEKPPGSTPETGSPSK